VASGQCAAASKQQARRELLEVYGLFASEYDYRPVDLKTLPYRDFCYQYARSAGASGKGADPAAPGDQRSKAAADAAFRKRVLLSHGAIQCMEKLLGLLADDGFILMNDYGQTQVTGEEEFEHQRFSLATFVGLNFPLLKAYFDRGGAGQVASGEKPNETAEDNPSANGQSALTTRHLPRATWVEPDGEAGGIHSRLLGHQISQPVREKFQAAFGKLAYERLHEPIEKARQCVKVGRFEMAAEFYHKALELQPGNWVLANEIAMFLIFNLRDVKAGIDMAKVALVLNPTCSADLWSTLGDGLFEYGRTAEAKSAYLKALSVNASDVRSRYNLAWVHAREKDFPAALSMIAEALSLDKTGEYRDRLLQKQQEVVAQLNLRNQQEYLLLINLVSKYAKPREAVPTQPGATETQRHND
jgi:tetratricopeptide (TPR) repeat protein